MRSDATLGDPADLWQQALRHIAQHVSRTNYDTWLEGTEGLRVENGALVVGTRSEFVTEWIQKRLKPLIVRTLRRKMEAAGVEARFDCRMEDLIVSDCRVTGIATSSGFIPASVDRLSNCHSASDA